MNMPHSKSLLPPVFSKPNTPLQQVTMSPLAEPASRLMQCAPSLHCFRVTVLPSVLFSKRFRIAASRNVFMLLVTLVLFSPPSHGVAQVTIEYQYDDLNRLTGVARDDEAASVLYQYDAASNVAWIATDGSPDTDVDDIPNFVDPIIQGNNILITHDAASIRNETLGDDREA
jgi:hypothetical protein